MSKTILLTGATDGIGLAAATKLAEKGHSLWLHGRSVDKLQRLKTGLARRFPKMDVHTLQADLSDLTAVAKLAADFSDQDVPLDVLINNAGVFKTAVPLTPTGYDRRFVVNVLAPYLLTQRLLPLLTQSSRVVNIASAAQAPVDLLALAGKRTLSDSAAYAQSKLAIIMWSYYLAHSLSRRDVGIFAVNPASFLGSKMVQQAYGSAGKDINIGADILVQAATGDEFDDISGRYFDNDKGDWATPHLDALDSDKTHTLVAAIEDVIRSVGV